MASKAKSRWANEEEDAEFAARLRREKEERKRSKAERARQLEAERQAKSNKVAAGRNATTLNPPDQHPAKRRKVKPELDADADASSASGTRGDRTLLRLEGGHWAECRSVENFDKLNDIEEGTYGWVARARELVTGNIVALKRLKIDNNDRNGLPVTGLREIQILKDCRHRNIVHMQEVVVGGISDGTERSIFLVLEFIEHDLRSLLEDMPDPFLPSEIKRLLLQLGDGVAYLHDNWILHRDLKTSNLLLSNRGELKIADFGMARYVGDPPPKLTQLVVTLWYRAPELLLGTKTYGQAVDMWSVGCIFAELIDRKPILQGSNEVDQVSKIFELCGVPSEDSWPGFRRLPNAKRLRLPQASQATGSVIRAKFSTITNAARSLLGELLSLNPERRPSAKEMLEHEYFKQDPKPKQESMFPTFPSKAGQERRRRHEPNAPIRGQVVDLGEADLTGIFHGREKEERGGGFALRMV